MSSRFVSFLTMVVALGLVASMFPVSPGVYAQESAVGETSGVTVSYGDDWSYVADASTSSDRADSLVFTRGGANYAVAAFPDGLSDIDHAMSLLSLPGEVADIEVADTYALRTVEAHGVAYGVFNVVTGDSVHTVVAPVGTFAEALDAVQESVQVNDAPVLAGVDGAALQAIFVSAASGDGASTGNAETEALLQPAGDIGVADDEELPDLVEDDDLFSEVEATPDVTADEALDDEAESTTGADAGERAADSDATGFVDDNTWVSPQFGIRVTWGTEWQPRMFGTEPDFTSHEDGQYSYDYFCLQPTSGANTGRFCITVKYVGDYLGTPAHWNDTYGSAEATGSAGIPYYSVIVTDDGFAAADTNLDGTWADVNQGHAIGDILIEQEIHGEIDALADLLDAANADVVVDNQPALHFIDPDTFRAENDVMVAALPDIVQQRDDELAAMGLIDPNHYVSTAMACDVAWSDALRMSGMDSMTPIRVQQYWNSLSSESVPGEVVSLWPTETGVSFRVTCFASLDSMDGFYDWDHEEAIRIEGTNADYAIRQWSENSFGVYMVIKPIGEPTVVVNFDVSRDQLIEAQENGEAGTLIVQGVDILAALQEDDLVSHLP